jgi:hypothetical protein
VLAGIAVLALWYPRAVAYPLGAIATWLACAVLIRGLLLIVRRRRGARAHSHPAAAERTQSAPDE